MEEKIDRDLAAITSDQKILLDQIFAAGACEPLITEVEQSSQQAGYTLHEKIYKSDTIYKSVLKYAIFRKAHDFIVKMLNHDKIVKHLNHQVLYEYSKTQDLNFQSLALAAMVNHPTRHDGFSISAQFHRAAQNLFTLKPSSDTNTSNLIQAVLQQNLLIVPKLKIPYLRTWIFAYARALAHSESKDKIREIFLKYLPKEADNIQIVIMLLTTTLHSDNEIMLTLKALTKQYAFTSEMAVKALEDISNPKSLLIAIDILIEFFDKNDNQYQKYNLLSKILKSDLKERPQLILDNLSILSPYVLAENLVYCLIDSIGIEGRKFFIEWYIKNPNFEYGPLICRYLNICDEKLTAQYLSTPHVLLPIDCLSKVMSRFMGGKELRHLIPLLLSREDFVFIKRDLYQTLFNLLTHDEQHIMPLFLDNVAAFDLLKKYEQERGDDQLSMENRGTLMPSIIAYYLPQPRKAQELLFSFSKEMRKELLHSIVNYTIDRDQPSLRAAIIKAGDRELINAIGGSQPRFVGRDNKNNLTIFASRRLRTGKVLENLRIFQKKISNQFAKNHSDSLIQANPTIDASISQSAQYLANHCGINNLILQHQTSFTNGQNALRDNCLKTRFHIENHPLNGKAANGLTFKFVSVLNTKSVFTFFTRISLADDKTSITTHFKELQKTEVARFVFDIPQLLKENPHITFIVLGDYPNFQEKNLQLPDGSILISNPSNFDEGRNIRRIEFNNPHEAFTAIHQNLFEVVYTQIINSLAEPLKSSIIKQLGDLSLEENRKLACDLLNLINLEWLIPGDIPLKLSYVNHIELGDRNYNLAQLRNTATHGNENEVLKAIANCEGIENLPFVVNGILAIAFQRRHENVINAMARLKTIKRIDNVTYYPDEIYQIESLVQLLLEDLDNDRIYVHYTGHKLLINSMLVMGTNRGGAHHAEMAKLHYALGIGELQGKNALGTVLNSNLELPVGEGELFKSLVAVRDALLSYELTTLLTSHQNTAFYQNNNGAFHPVTGKGATNGLVALLARRLSLAGSAYEINASYSDDNKYLQVRTGDLKALNVIATCLAKALQISGEKIKIQDNSIMLAISPIDLIANLRRQAIFYEGINILTAQGSLLLAHRHDKGLASAGGHHSNKYSSKDIAYGLRSEFGLVFKNPDHLEQDVILMNGVKTISKTGIYLVSLNSLQATEEAKNYAHKNQMPVAFYADPDEFAAGSEVVLSLSQMRGQQFYDVMPLEELCIYQLNLLQNYLYETFPEISPALSLTINHQVDNIATATVMCKVPGAQFGEVTITSGLTLPRELKDVFSAKGKLVHGEKEAYVFDENPLAMIQFINEALNASYQNFLN